MSTGAIVFLVLLIVGGTFVAFAVIFTIHDQRLRERCTVSTYATVIDYEERWSSDSDGGGHYSYYPVLQYEAQGYIYTEVHNVGTRPPAYELNQEVELMYNELNPREFYIVGSNLALVICTIFGVVGAALLVVDALLVFYRIRGWV